MSANHRFPPGELAELNRNLREMIGLLRENLEALRAGGGGAPGERPKSKKLVGWDAIRKVSEENGGPGSESQLRTLCRKRGAPVLVWRGMAAVADEQKFIVWLEGLRTPIGLEPIGARGKSWRSGQKGPKTKPKRAP